MVLAEDVDAAPSARAFSLAEVLQTSLSLYLRCFHVVLASALLPILPTLVLCCCGVIGGAMFVGISGAEGADAGQGVGVLVGLASMLVFMVGSIVPLGIQAHAVGERLEGRPASVLGSLYAIRGSLLSFLPVAIAYGAVYLVASAMCLLPGIVFAGFFSLAPILTIVEDQDPEGALTRSLHLTRTAGGEVFVPVLLHGLGQALLFGLFAVGCVIVDGTSNDHIAATIVLEVIYAIGAWVLFTYFAIVVPVVLHRRLVGPRDTTVAGLEEIFR